MTILMLIVAWLGISYDLHTLTFIGAFVAGVHWERL